MNETLFTSQLSLDESSSSQQPYSKIDAIPIVRRVDKDEQTVDTMKMYLLDAYEDSHKQAGLLYFYSLFGYFSF
jgi:hypothetical protein